MPTGFPLKPPCPGEFAWAALMATSRTCGRVVILLRRKSMAHILKSTDCVGNRPLDMTADADTQVDGLERLAELARHASPEGRARLENTIEVIARSRQTQSMTLKTVQQVEEELALVEQVTLVAEAHNMDEERRSSAELHIL